MVSTSDVVRFFCKLIFLKIHREYPGFIILSYDFKKVKIFERDIFLPEDFLADLEEEIVKKSGEQGGEELYKVGKTFMWNYLKLVNVVPVSQWNELEKYCKEFEAYFTIASATKIKHKLLENPPILELYIKDWIACRKNGLGFTNTGMAAGLGFAIGEKRVEATQIECQGRGNEKCTVVIGLPENILKLYPSVKIYNYPTVEDYKIGDATYKIFNRVREVSNPFSLSHFREKDNICFDTRHFYVEITFLHLLEYNIDEKILFNIAQITGSRIAKRMKGKSPQEVCNFLSATGFGEVNYYKLGKEEIVKILHYPYSCCLKNSNFPYICGFLSGAFSTLFGEEIRVNVGKYEITDTLSLILKIQRL